jgi:hypothetical protein
MEHPAGETAGSQLQGIPLPLVEGMFRFLKPDGQWLISLLRGTVGKNLLYLM